MHKLRDIEWRPQPDAPFDWSAGSTIAIDFGTHMTRAGYTDSSGPNLVFPTLTGKYRERKSAGPGLAGATTVGYDNFIEPSTRLSARSPYDGALVSNWTVAEEVLDYTFAKLRVGSDGAVDNHIIMNELMSSPAAQRRNLQQVLFEGYGVKSVALGVDALFSYYANDGKTGLVLSVGNEATHIIPVVDGVAQRELTKRITWGGRTASAFLAQLLQLKYPTFPLKLSATQTTKILEDHCYVSDGYKEELDGFLDMDGLEKRERVIQAPYIETVKTEKSAEELERIAERRKESGRRLQEQAAAKRAEKLAERENDLQYYRQQAQVLEDLGDDRQGKRDARRILDSEGFKDVKSMHKKIAELERTIRKSLNQDVEEEEVVPEFPLADVPDEELTPVQVKEKRHQRLLRANYEARLRAKEEKEAEKARLEEEKRKDEEWRTTDLAGWVEDKREKRNAILFRQKERAKMQKELRNRKSMASKMRMKNIATLAADTRATKRARPGAGIDDDPDDTFGADDQDWSIYNDIANQSDSEEEENERATLAELEANLLEFDDDFTEENLLESQTDWKSSLLHMFLHGPTEYNPESQEQQNQLHLNVERIRVPEVLFQPTIAGIDQAGVAEVCGDILTKRFPSETASVMLKDVFVTGGYSQVPNFDARLTAELRSLLPAGSLLQVRSAAHPETDAWMGMAKWSKTDDYKKSRVTRAMYEEMGPDYIKEHAFSNSSYL